MQLMILWWTKIFQIISYFHYEPSDEYYAPLHAQFCLPSI